ncbi:MAG TPA: hypothetical protein IAC40_05855 [Candidatus Faecivivens stercorigallinarum]|nr:hypothetical protein [Candidatus Faecivivens stercorigallinarum]
MMEWKSNSDQTANRPFAGFLSVETTQKGGLYFSAVVLAVFCEPVQITINRPPND